MPEKQDGNRDAKGRFVKGQTGNPKGRPRLEHSVTQYLRDQEMGNPIVAMRLREAAERGEPWAVMYYMNRIEGTPKQAVELSGPDQGPIAMKWDDGEGA